MASHLVGTPPIDREVIGALPRWLKGVDVGADPIRELRHEVQRNRAKLVSSCAVARPQLRGLHSCSLHEGSTQCATSALLVLAASSPELPRIRLGCTYEWDHSSASSSRLEREPSDATSCAMPCLHPHRSLWGNLHRFGAAGQARGGIRDSGSAGDDGRCDERRLGARCDGRRLGPRVHGRGRRSRLERCRCGSRGQCWPGCPDPRQAGDGWRDVLRAPP